MARKEYSRFSALLPFLRQGAKADGKSNRPKIIRILSREVLAVYLIGRGFTGRPRARLDS